jgi:hypothetical protein
MLSKLPFPSWECNTDVAINIVDGLTEDGEPNVVATYSGKCNYSEKSKKTLDEKRRLIELNGTVIMEGDISPCVAKLSGNVTINGITQEIYRGSRPRNPDGSIHHTKLELV